MGREISAAGFRDTLDRYAQWGLPLIVTENGTTTNGRPPEAEPGEPLELGADVQEQAAMYVLEHLYEVGRAVAAGVDIRGYYHWSLTDNFEWAEGFGPRVGLYTVDYTTYDRTPTAGATTLGEIAAARTITEAQRDLLGGLGPMTVEPPLP
jgi:beta-glucosidase